MNELQVFKNQEFGQVRSLVINGEPWLVGKDVTKALGYDNPSKAIRRQKGGGPKRYPIYH